MILKNLILGIVLVFGYIVMIESAASDYFHLCHRNEPNLSNCVTQTLQKLVTRLRNGIPELGIIATEPLHIERVEFKPGSDNTGIVSNLTNVSVWGLSTTEISDVVAKLTKKAFYARLKMKFPLVRIEGTYDLDTKILFLPLKGHGLIQVNSTNAVADVTSKAERILRNGKEYLRYDYLNGTLDLANARVSIQGLFKDPTLNKATNDVINDNFNILFDDIRPSIMKSVFQSLMDLGKQAVASFTVDELFPK